MKNTLKTIKKENKTVVESSNDIGRSIGLAVHFTRNNCEFKLENCQVEEIDGTRYRVPLFYKVHVETNNGKKTCLVGPNVFIDSSTLTLYKIRSRFNDKKEIETRIQMLHLGDIQDCILEILDEIEIDKDSSVRTQWLKNKLDGAPWDLIVEANGETRFQRRWKW